jgi:hypothetical protein
MNFNTNNTNNITSYIESQKSYQVFNIDYTQKEINCFKNFNIEKFGTNNIYCFMLFFY